MDIVRTVGGADRDPSAPPSSWRTHLPTGLPVPGRLVSPQVQGRDQREEHQRGRHRGHVDELGEVLAAERQCQPADADQPGGQHAEADAGLLRHPPDESVDTDPRCYPAAVALSGSGW